MKIIVINSKKHGRFEVMVDDEDYDRAKDINWMIFVGKKRRTQYAHRYVKRLNGKQTYQWMHRFIMNPPDKSVIDHIDGNGLNNQKPNLRICTQRQNILNQATRSNNSSGFKGVHFCNREKRWAVAISVDGKKKFLGYFNTAEEGHDVWKGKSMELRGQFHSDK